MAENYLVKVLIPTYFPFIGVMMEYVYRIELIKKWSRGSKTNGQIYST
jgi:hypothetical protein